MNKILKHLASIRLIAVLALCTCAAQALAGSVVVVGASSTIGPTSKSDIIKVFLGKKKALPGASVVPIDQDDGNGVRLDFYKKIVKKTQSQLQSYWSRLIFTGKGQAPQMVGGDEEVKSMVATNPNLIGYIDEASVDASVKVIYKP